MAVDIDAQARIDSFVAGNHPAVTLALIDLTKMPALDEAMASYWSQYDALLIDGDARSSRMLIIDEHPDRWEVQQLLADPEGDHGWRIRATIDLAASDEQGEPVARIASLAEG